MGLSPAKTHEKKGFSGIFKEARLACHGNCWNNGSLMIAYLKRFFHDIGDFSSFAWRSTWKGIKEPIKPAEFMENAYFIAYQSLTVVLFTGFEPREIGQMPAARRVLEHVDVLIAGRYQAGQRLARGLMGSANKQIRFLSERYTPTDFASLPEAEVVINPDGSVVWSGIDPLSATLPSG